MVVGTSGEHDEAVSAPRRPMTRRLVLVPASGPRDPLRRYRLARLDEIALGTPMRPQDDEERKPARMDPTGPP